MSLSLSEYTGPAGQSAAIAGAGNATERWGDALKETCMALSTEVYADKPDFRIFLQ